MWKWLKQSLQENSYSFSVQIEKQGKYKTNHVSSPLKKAPLKLANQTQHKQRIVTNKDKNANQLNRNNREKQWKQKLLKIGGSIIFSLCNFEEVVWPL